MLVPSSQGGMVLPKQKHLTEMILDDFRICTPVLPRKNST